MALRVYRMLKKLNGQQMIGPFYKFTQKLKQSGYVYEPTKKGVCYLGALLLKRFSQLDKLLFLCGRSADSSMGYIELRHLLTFNLMSIAMLSEVSTETIRKMNQILQIYLDLSIWFRKYSNRFPSTRKQLQRMLAYRMGGFGKKVVNKFMKERDMAIFYREIKDSEDTADLRRNIDDLLKEHLIFKRPINQSPSFRLEAAIGSDSLHDRKIRFEESTNSLEENELVNFDGVVVLEGMDAFTGTTSGVLKGLRFSNSSFLNYRTAQLSSSADFSICSVSDEQNQPIKALPSAVTAMSFSGADQMEILVGRENGRVDHFNSLTDQFNALFALPQPSELKGIHRIDGDRILTAQECGTLAVWSASGERQTTENWTAGENLLTMRTEPGERTGVFATGGRENPLKVWNLEEQKCVFTAKNVRPNALELRVPIWVTCCRFLGETGQFIVTSTGKSQLRLYDLRAQRRPLFEEKWLDEPILALSTCCRDWQVIAGNSRGEVGLFDLRSSVKSRLLCKFKGFAGAVRHIDASPSHPQILSCGIDRFAIVHDLISHKILRKIYCKVQLNCCLICTDNSFVTKSEKKLRNGEKTQR
ncbi:hypothetical protein niasHS_002512 [Heterodera schachtii]|uniref:Uncharacterized protein n=1 Tax=Heterodera schachtii TaxID=97005 RepID=A0ABD2KK77_HETSC